jgi:DNA-binding response OmpR family regulator
MLLERPGHIVLREEIRKQLWPNDIMVEFDQSINAAVRRLRDALRDSADKPATSRPSRGRATAAFAPWKLWTTRRLELSMRQQL